MDPRVERIQEFPVQITSPAAGAEILITARGQGLWRVMSLCYTLTTSAVVGTRISRLSVDDQTTTYLRMLPAASQAASLTVDYAAYGGAFVPAALGNHIEHGWPHDGVALYPGHQLHTVTDAIDAGDQYSGIGMFVRELPTGRYLLVTPTETVNVEEYYGV